MSGQGFVHPELSGKVAVMNVHQCSNYDVTGKLLVLHRMMMTMRATKNGERIVIVSNYTSTLDLIELMCRFA